MITRRQALKTTALAAAAAATVPSMLAQPSATPLPSGPFTLPTLPYAFDALEPHIDARTMEIHHGRHHKAYVDNLNRAIAELPEPSKKSVEALLEELNTSTVPEKIRPAVRNNGGGHYNHSLFWQMMKKDGGGEPKGELAAAIEKNFGNFTDFKTKFTEAATKVFGSGWAWLSSDGRRLQIVSTPNQDSPLTHSPEIAGMARRYGISGPSIFLGLDVWEHAYYLKYQNKRADYIAAWWNVVNWDFVSERYAKLVK